MKTAAEVLRSLDSKMGMITREILLEWLETGNHIDIIDLRSISAWNASHIQGAKQVLIQELPDTFGELLPERTNRVVCVCNGSVQSAMAVVFLRSEGYENSFNLSGGFSGWERAELPVEQA